jgi:hypothetical protein
MAPLTSPRRAAATITLVTAGALLLPAAPASATPADGTVTAFAYYRAAGGCEIQQAADGQVTKHFDPGTGSRTAKSTGDFQARDGHDFVTADGSAVNRTTGVAQADNGALDKVTFSARHVVRMHNDRGTDCGLGVIADSQSDAEVHVKRRGRLHIEWDRGRAGQIEQIYVARNGHVKLDEMRPDAHGSATIPVRRGDYTIFVQFITRANERDVPSHTTLTKRAHFSVVADYRR